MVRSCAATGCWSPPAGATAGSGEYAKVNGINLYYETHGEGSPLVLLHGGLGSGEMFGPILSAFAEHHRVILPDLQGHGRTADIDRPLDVRLMAGDIAALVDHLGLGASARTLVWTPNQIKRQMSIFARHAG